MVQNATSKYKSWLKKNPGNIEETPLGLKTTLTNLAISDYKDIILKKSNWSLFGPGDVLISKSNKDFDVVKDKDSVHAIITTTALPVAKPGKYKYLLDLGGMKIEYVFNVSFK